jgi:hypothetical protein
MGDDRGRVTPQEHPAGQGVAGAGDDKPAVRAKAGDEVISHWRDDAGINRRKREPGCSAGIGDGDPAVNDVLSEPRTNLRGIKVLTYQRNNAFAHTGKSGRHPRQPSATLASAVLHTPPADPPG